jgi:aspartyl-tRNA(Asn)/glutamyl-tRNA(Gln) amidotransferase subunit C
MAFSKQQLQKFADLIQIEMTPEQLDKINIDSIVEWLNDLTPINTTGVEPLLNPSEHKLPQRPDVVTDGNIRDLILANTPDNAGTSRGYFAVPKIMDGE